MSSRKEEFINGGIYHITIRGVEGREIFADDEDRWHCIFSLYEFNNRNTVTIREQRRRRQAAKEKIKSDRGLSAAALAATEKDVREKLVGLLGFVFMPNHIHLLVRQITAGGVSLFMQKLGSGYSSYFNGRHQRKGHLFQGKFSARHIPEDEDMSTVFTYIHTNPISLIDSGWKENGTKDGDAAKEFLLNYRWSSYLDYVGKRNFPSVSDREYILKIIGNSENAKKYIEDWIARKQK